MTDEKDERKGFFTSSNAHRLVTFGKAAGSIGAPFFTYVKEKRREISAGRSINNEAKANSTEWGNLCEQVLHDQLPLDYVLESSKRYVHPSLSWSGAPDGYIDDMVTDEKCPWTLTSFFDAVEDGIKKEYRWQLISNSILTGKPNCRSITFVPRRSDLDKIRAESEARGYKFQYKADYELPWLADDSKQDNIHIIDFTPTKEEIDLLTERMTLATRCLTDDDFFKQLKIDNKIK